MDATSAGTLRHRAGVLAALLLAATVWAATPLGVDAAAVPGKPTKVR
jgi:hypothetical protein